MRRVALLTGEDFQIVESITKEGYPMSLYFGEDLQKGGQHEINQFPCLISRFCLWADLWFYDQSAPLEVPTVPTFSSLPFLRAQSPLPSYNPKLGRPELLWKVTSTMPRCLPLICHSPCPPGIFFLGFRFDKTRVSLSLLWQKSLSILLLTFSLLLCYLITWTNNIYIPSTQQLSQAGEFDLFLILWLY